MTAAATQFTTLRNEQVLRREHPSDELKEHDAEAEHVGPGRGGNTQLQLNANMACANSGALMRGKKP